MYKATYIKYHEMDTDHPYATWNLSENGDVVVPDLMTPGEKDCTKEDILLIINEVVEAQ